MERALWIAAILLMAPLALSMAARELQSSMLLEVASRASGPGGDWAEERARTFQRLRQGGMPAPVAVIEFPRLEHVVPVFAGSGEAEFTLGGGLVNASDIPDAGLIAIAAHRDGYFRRLKDVQPGELIVLHEPSGTRRFIVDDRRVVAPEDTWLLDPVGFPLLRLITCHPFYFVGSAPQRYVVSASPVMEDM